MEDERRADQRGSAKVDFSGPAADMFYRIYTVGSLRVASVA